MRMGATTKLGMLSMANADVLEALSKREFCLYADHTAVGTASDSARIWP